MFYIGIYSHAGAVNVTTVYEKQETLHKSLHPSFQLLKVCEAPTKGELNSVVKEALKNYNTLPSLTEEEVEVRLTYTISKTVRVSGKTAQSRQDAAKYLGEVYQRSLEREGYYIILKSLARMS